MENLKKYITGIICCLCAILLMSHNTSAMTSVSVTPIGSANWCINGSGVTDATVTCHMIQNLNNDITVVANNMDIVTQGSYYTDTVLDIELTFYRNSNTTSTHAGVNGIESLSSNWALMSYEYQQLNSNTGVIHLFVKSLTNNNNQHILISGHQSFFYLLQPQDRVTGANVGIYAINNTVADYSSIVNAIQAQPNYTQNLNNINNGINNINNSVNNINDDVEDATQDAADDASDAADANSTNQQTSNLIGVLQNFLSAITNFSGTNCNISLAFPSYAGGNMNVNVCQNKDKAGNIIGVFTSLTLIVFYLPLALKLLSMIYNEIRSFTNG